jgi:hypothetical protein
MRKRKSLDTIILAVNYFAGGSYLILGIINRFEPGIGVGLGYLSLTALYHMEMSRRENLESHLKDHLDKFPDSNTVIQDGAKKASEFKKMSTYEKSILETGFISGVEYVYSKLNGK